MKKLWNQWLKQSVFLYTALYTIATIMNSILYLMKDCYEDPNGNWHEIDRAIIVFIVVLAFMLIKYLKMKNYWIKSLLVYVPTMLLVFFYVWVVGFRDTLAVSAYRDVFVNYTIGFVIVSVIGWVLRRMKYKKTDL